MTTPIPTPLGLPLIGNVFDLDPENSLKSFTHLAEIYGMNITDKGPSLTLTLLGPIYNLRLPTGNTFIISNHSLYDELCDEKRFTKVVDRALEELRNGIHDGLFTAHAGEHAWGVAHRILMPAFGPLAIREMFDGTSQYPH